MKKLIPDRQYTGEFREAEVSRLRQEVARLNAITLQSINGASSSSAIHNAVRRSDFTAMST